MLYQPAKIEKAREFACWDKARIFAHFQYMCIRWRFEITVLTIDRPSVCTSLDFLVVVPHPVVSKSHISPLGVYKPFDYIYTYHTDNAMSWLTADTTLSSG